MPVTFPRKDDNFHIKKTRQVYSVSRDVHYFDIVYEAYTILPILRPVLVRSNVRRTEALAIAEDF